MASDNEACCESDPNFAVICGFLEKFGVTCGLTNIDFLDLQDMLENNQEVPQELVDLHVKLLRKARKSVSSERWERAIIKLCHGFCSQDAWEIERFGYKKARLSSKLRILKELLEMQFDYNAKFKNEINKLSAEELRTQPLGRDRVGHVYWFQSDNSCQIRVYKEDPDEETWALVAKDREGLVNLITQLNDGQETMVNEDSNSLESEKPVVDTGQTDSNSNSNSSKQDQASTDTNTEENQTESVKKEDSDGEKPQVDEEDITNSAEATKPNTIRLRAKKGLIIEDSRKVDELVGNGSNEESTTEQESKSEPNSDKDEKEKSLAVEQAKPGISIRIKPMSELISGASLEVNKKLEITGVKEKYIRTDSSTSSSVHHRKAVDSAGFDVHTNYLKRPIEEEMDVEEPRYIKRPRMDRPTLLSNKKKKPYSDEEEEVEEVSDETEEPLMLVTGEGSGQDNEGGNLDTPEMESQNLEDDSPIIGEEIEESIVYFYGEGNGHECETGNDNKSDKQDVTSSEQNKTAAVDSASESSNLNLQHTSEESNKADTVDSIKGVDPSSNFDEAECSVKTPAKTEFKLGTIIDVRTNKSVSCTRDPAKKSRWDIGKPDDDFEIESQTTAEEIPEIKLSDANSCSNKSDVKLESEALHGNDLDLPKSPRGKVQELVNQWEKLSTPAQKSKELQKGETITHEVHDNSTSTVPKKSMFFFGPGCLQVKPTISPLKSGISSELDEKSVTSKQTLEMFNEDHGKTQILNLETHSDGIDTLPSSEIKPGSFEVTEKTEKLLETDSQLKGFTSDIKEPATKLQAQKNELIVGTEAQIDAQRDLTLFESKQAEGSEAVEDEALKIEAEASKFMSIQDNNLFSTKKDFNVDVADVEEVHIKIDVSEKDVYIDSRQVSDLSRKIPFHTMTEVDEASKNNEREVKGALEKCDILNLSLGKDKSSTEQPDTSTSVVLKLGAKEQEELDKTHSLPNNIVPANRHVPKNSVSEKEPEKIDTSVSERKNELSDVPVSEKSHTLDASNKTESGKEVPVSSEVVGLPKEEVEVGNSNTSVLESKPKSKLEDVQEDIKQVNVQKTDNIDIGNKTKESIFSDQTIEMQMAIITGETLPDSSDFYRETVSDSKVLISSSGDTNQSKSKSIENSQQGVKSLAASETVTDIKTLNVSNIKDSSSKISPNKEGTTRPISGKKIILKRSFDADTSATNKSIEAADTPSIKTQEAEKNETCGDMQKNVSKSSDINTSTTSKSSQVVDVPSMNPEKEKALPGMKKLVLKRSGMDTSTTSKSSEEIEVPPVSPRKEEALPGMKKLVLKRSVMDTSTISKSSEVIDVRSSEAKLNLEKKEVSLGLKKIVLKRSFDADASVANKSSDLVDMDSSSIIRPLELVDKLSVDTKTNLEKKETSSGVKKIVLKRSFDIDTTSTIKPLEEIDDKLSKKVDNPLEKVDNPLENVDKHLEKVDKPPEKVDKSSEKDDKLPEIVDIPLEEFDKPLEKLKASEKVGKPSEKVNNSPVDTAVNCQSQPIASSLKTSFIKESIANADGVEHRSESLPDEKVVGETRIVAPNLKKSDKKQSVEVKTLSKASPDDKTSSSGNKSSDDSVSDILVSKASDFEETAIVSSEANKLNERLNEMEGTPVCDAELLRRDSKVCEDSVPKAQEISVVPFDGKIFNKKRTLDKVEIVSSPTKSVMDSELSKSDGGDIKVVVSKVTDSQDVSPVSSSTKIVNVKQTSDKIEVLSSANKVSVDVELPKNVNNISNVDISKTPSTVETSSVWFDIKKSNKKQSLNTLQVKSSVSKSVVDVVLPTNQQECLGESSLTKKIEDKPPVDKAAFSTIKPMLDKRSSPDLLRKSADAIQKVLDAKKSCEKQKSNEAAETPSAVDEKPSSVIVDKEVSVVNTEPSNIGSEPSAVDTKLPAIAKKFKEDGSDSSVKVPEEIQPVKELINAKHDVKTAIINKDKVVHDTASVDTGVFRNPGLYRAKKCTPFEKPAIDIDEVIVNATSGLPSNINSGIISLTEMLSTSEKVPISATKGGINKSSKKFLAPIVSEPPAGSPGVSKQSISKLKGSDQISKNKVLTDVKAKASTAAKKTSLQALDLSEDKRNKQKIEVNKVITNSLVSHVVGGSTEASKTPDLPQKQIEFAKVTSTEVKELETVTPTDKSTETAKPSANLLEEKKAQVVDSIEKLSTETKDSVVDLAANKKFDSAETETKDFLVETPTASLHPKGLVGVELGNEPLETKSSGKSFVSKTERTGSIDRVSKDEPSGVTSAVDSRIKSSVEAKNSVEGQSSTEEERSDKSNDLKDKPSKETKTSVESVSSKEKLTAGGKTLFVDIKDSSDLSLTKDKLMESSTAALSKDSKESLAPATDLTEPIILKDRKLEEVKVLLEPLFTKREGTETKDLKLSIKVKESSAEPCTDVSGGKLVTEEPVKSVSVLVDDNSTNRRVTRRTRSSTTDKSELAVESKNKKSVNNKVATLTKKTDAESDQASSKKGKKLVTENFDVKIDDVEEKSPKFEEPDVQKVEIAKSRMKLRKTRLSKGAEDEEQSSDKTANEPEITEDTNRELRQRKLPETNKNVGKKPKGKRRAKAKVVPQEGKNMSTRSQAKDKASAGKSESSKENVEGGMAADADIGDIEEQIVKTEIRPTKKLKLSDVVDVSVDKNKKPVLVQEFEKAESEKVVKNEDNEDKELPKPRRSLRSSQSNSTDNAEKSKNDRDKATNETSEKHYSDKKEKEVSEDQELKPVDEPKCIQKKVPLLTCVDINKLKAPSEEIKSDDKEQVVDSPQSVESCGFAGDGDVCGDSSDDAVVEISENDPLACSEEDAVSEPVQPPMTMATFKLDVEDSLSVAPVMRITRKRAAQQSIDALRETPPQGKKTPLEKKDEGDSKRPKLKKRSVDRNLRRSVEEQKLKAVSSSEEDDNEGKAQNETSAKQDSGKKSKGIAKRRISTRSTRATESPAPSSDAPSEASRTDASNTPPVTKEKKPRKQKKTLLGLEISEVTESILKNDAPSAVRQSRRIAQLKIKEEAERRKLEEVTFQELKDEQRKRKGKKGEDKDYKLEKRKRNKNVPTEDETTGDAESDEKKKRKRKRKHWDPTKKFDLFKAWKTSSGSSSSEIEDEEEEIEEDDDHQLVIKSDHEFSPESDLEEGGEVQPLKRARTARKESDAEEVDDCACQKCGQKDHPEWILLCDSCDCGWHCSCLRPALLVIPEGDWFCPPCQHITLVKNLEVRLHEYDRKLNKKEMETRRKERLAYVGISLDNVLPSKESDDHRHKHRQHEDKESAQEEQDSGESGSDESDSDSESSSSSDSDSEPVYQLRERRQAHSYRFNDYDELINSAIQDELEAVKGAGNQGRGKDITTIVNAEKEEAEAQRLKNEVAASGTEVAVNDGTVLAAPIDATVAPGDSAVAPEAAAFEPLPPVVPPDYDSKLAGDDSDNEPIRPVKKIIGKKKHRKLNSLDVSSGDDAESDEDFKGSSSSESEEDFDEDEYSGSESSEADTKRGKRRKDFGPVRRSTRARISRYDRDFINDSDSEEVEAPRRKKTKSVWDESESEESDRSWGRKKRKAAKSRRRKSTGKVKKSKKKKKKKRTGDDSDPEVYRKRPNIKFGGLNDDEDVGRRTRGKKINYLEALGTDSEEEIRRKPPRIEESEEEYNLHEDEDFQQQMENDKDSDESGVDTVLQDIAKNTQPRPKARGRGKAGLKIPRKPKDAPPPEFPSVIPDLSQPPSELPPVGVEPTVLQAMQQMQPLQPLQSLPQLVAHPPMLEPPTLQEQELQDPEDEPNPIEQINKNVEQMNEQEMEKMMEEEDYANKQLQLVALQIEKEKKRKEREAKRLEKLMEKEQKIPKKRGRKPKSQVLGGNADLVPPFSESASMLMNSVMANNAELSEPPGVSLPMFSEIAPVLNPDGTPKKRRGRGKGKKTLAAEAAAIAAAASANKDNPEMDMGLEGPASSGSNTVSPAPDSPMHGSKLGIAAPPQPFSQSQPTPSVITRMLQSQPGQGNFPGGGSKYFGGLPSEPQLGPPSGSGPYHPGGPRGPMPGPYQQPPPGMPHYPVVRSGPVPPHRLHSPGPPGLPPMYHSHRSMDPSPSGGGPINVSTANRDRHSPAVVPPAASSPLSKGDPTPPPPPYTRPQVGHFPPAVSSAATGPRHVSMVPPHLQQHRASNMSPYHPGVPPNYHYGSYPPPPPLNTDEGQSPPVYPSPAYSESYPGESGAPVQPTEGGGNKSFDEETGGEFVGLVSYFSSQREDDLDT